MSIAQLLVFGLSVAAAKGSPVACGGLIPIGGGGGSDGGGVLDLDFLPGALGGGDCDGGGSGGVVALDVLNSASGAGTGLLDVGILPGTGSCGGGKGIEVGILDGLFTLSLGSNNQQACSTFSTAAKYGKCNDMNDVFRFWLTLSRAIGYVLDCWIPELGTWFSNACLCMTRMVACCNGKSQSSLIDINHLFGSKKPAMCESSYLSNLGYQRYSGKYDRSMLSTCGCDSAVRRVTVMINKYTRNRGIECLKGPRRSICDSVLVIANIIDCDPSSWGKKHIITMIKHISIIVGIIGNSYKERLGNQIVGQILNYCNGPMKKHGWGECVQYRREIEVTIQTCSTTRYCFKHCLKCDCDANDEFDSCQEDCGCKENDDKCTNQNKCKTPKPCPEDCDCEDGNDDCTNKRPRHKKSKDCGKQCDCGDDDEDCSNQKRTKHKKSKQCDSDCDCGKDDDSCSNRRKSSEEIQCEEVTKEKKVSVEEKSSSKKCSHKSSSECDCEE